MSSEKNHILKLNQKPVDKFGLAGMILSIVSLGTIIAAIIYAALLQFPTRNQEMITGGIEVIAIGLTIIAMVLSIVGETSKDMEKIYAHIGIVICVLEIIYHSVLLYIAYT